MSDWRRRAEKLRFSKIRAWARRASTWLWMAWLAIPLACGFLAGKAVRFARYSAAALIEGFHAGTGSDR